MIYYLIYGVFFIFIAILENLLLDFLEYRYRLWGTKTLFDYIKLFKKNIKINLNR